MTKGISWRAPASVSVMHHMDVIAVTQIHQSISLSLSSVTVNIWNYVVNFKSEFYGGVYKKHVAFKFCCFYLNLQDKDNKGLGVFSVDRIRV